MKECIKCGSETAGRRPLCDDCAPDDVEGDDEPAIEVEAGGDSSLDLFSTRAYSFPDTMLNSPLWLNWAYTDDGRKIPRAPWRYTDRPGRWSANKDPENWTDHETAREWGASIDGHHLAYYLPDPEYSEVMDEYDVTDEDLPVAPRVGLIDYDDVLDPKTHEAHPLVAEMVEEVGTYADLSPSWTGIHQYGSFRLPEGYQSLKIDISTPEWPDAEIEVYDGRRFTTMSGDHIRGTPSEVRGVQDTIDAWVDEHGEKDVTSRPSDWTPNPERERDWDDYEPEATEASEQAESMDDIIYALDHLDARDVAERTIVHAWNDDISTSNGKRAFYPIWGRNSNGRANIVDENLWNDTGGGGYGTPVTMALVDMGEMRPESADPRSMGGEQWADGVDHLRDLGFDIPDWPEPTTDGENAEPATLIPANLIEAAGDESAREVVQEHGFDVRAVDHLRDELRDTVTSAMAECDYTVVRAPTGSGKTYLSSTTPWRELEETTGGQPVMLLEPTRDARDEAFEMAQEAGVEAHRLLGRTEACPVARGDYDLDDDADSESFGIEGMSPSGWFSKRCDDQGIPFSVAHSWADQLVPGGLPCSRDGVTCPAHSQHDGVPRDDDGRPTHDVVIATHNFAYVPGYRNMVNLIIDEEPDFSVDADEKRLKEGVNAYLKWLDGPIRNFGDLAREQETHDGERTKAERARRRGLTPGEHQSSVERRMDNLLDGFPRHYTEDDRYDDDEEEEEVPDDAPDLSEYADLPAQPEVEEDEEDEENTGQPPMDWYFENTAGHTMAPAIARAVWRAEDRGNGRLVGKVAYEPPRFERSSDEGYNRVWVTVILDRDYNILDVRSTPYFGTARSVVGLDAHVTENNPDWKVNVTPNISVSRVLDEREESLYRRFARGLEVVQVGSAINPLTSRRWWDEEGSIGERAEMVVSSLNEQYDGQLRTGITSMDVEEDLRGFLDATCDGPAQTMHYGATKSRNDFEGESVGFVVGAIDPGDEAVLNRIAELGLDARPVTSDEPCSACDGADHGCQECEWTGRAREHGRQFEGPDADAAQAALESVRQNEVAQAIGRYARNADDPDDRATVYAMTAAVPENMVDIEVPGVEWTFSDAQRAVYDALESASEPMTAPDLAEHTGLSRQAVWASLEKAADYGLVQKRAEAGDYGAHLYAPTEELGGDGVVEAGSSSTPLGTTHTGGFTITARRARHLRPDAGPDADEGAEPAPREAESDAPPG